MRTRLPGVGPQTATPRGMRRIAVPACERRIVGSRQSAMLAGNDMLNVERAPERRLRQMTVLATTRGALPDFPGKLAHAPGRKAWRALDCQ
jgi:hypothetical protein